MSAMLSRHRWSIQGAGADVAAGALKLFVVGFAARDVSTLDHHTEELRAHGVKVPRRLPVIWTLSSDLLGAREISPATVPRSSGEVEPVLVRIDGRWLVTVGSDHTDRELERHTLVGSKRACPKPVSATCWTLDRVLGRWDSLVLRSWVRHGDEWTIYQEGTCSGLRPAEWYVEQITRRRPVGDCAVFCGTVPTIRGLVLGGDGFRCELEDPVDGFRLRCQYELSVDDR